MELREASFPVQRLTPATLLQNYVTERFLVPEADACKEALRTVVGLARERMALAATPSAGVEASREAKGGEPEPEAEPEASFSLE